ncbi:peptide ABC transporter substrate-binding protein [Paenibacillus abyssi]|uniref:Peptide ABC transporter substrate-binding protein n=1 Tax=Paenibacillus abyssi TaxID=1340531 RepID=A0A917FV72_9BACL|nr:peptide ABC transporter substrate-binding protein [Paenibacillus abyssi]GGG03667.1 peptide ABC transporter substrate-binding protein [Paenibacillus abyssi]
MSIRFHKIVSVAMVFILVSTALLGCAGKEKELTINYRAEPPVLDVSKAEAQAAFTLLNELNEGLYRIDKEGNPVPGLAKDMPKVSEDKLTYTIELREGLKWADGSALTANDFIYSFLRTLDPATKAPYAFLLGWIKGGNDILNAKTPEEAEAAKANFGAKAVGDTTLEITLEKPVAFFTQLLGFSTFFPQKQDMVEKAGESYGGDPDKVIGAGPFKLEKWNHGQSLEFVKNENYWDAENIKLENFKLNIVKDGGTAVNLYKTKATDVTTVSGDRVTEWKGKPDLVSNVEQTTTYIHLNQKNFPPFANKKIRQALSMSIDLQKHVDVVLNNGTKPSNGFVPATQQDGNNQEFRTVAGDTQLKYDPAQAKQLLAEGLKELNLTSLPKFQLQGDDIETGKKSLEFIVGQWKDNLGIEVEAVPLPHKNRVQNELDKTIQASLTLWGADYNDPMTFLDLLTTDSPFNASDYSNKEFDELMKTSDFMPDTVTRSQNFVKAEKILMDDAAIIPLYFRTSTYLVNPRLEGFFLQSLGYEFELRWASLK